MAYFWVNHNQTHKLEVAGGYLWSPKRNADDSFNANYDFMRDVAPGDIVFSCANQKIANVGVARSFAYESLKPEAYDSGGNDWAKIGWRVDVKFDVLHTPFIPKEYLEMLQPLLPSKYSPINRTTGFGAQSYLSKLSDNLGSTLTNLAQVPREDIEKLIAEYRNGDGGWIQAKISMRRIEDIEAEKVQKDPGLSETVRTSVINARVGQGLFREGVSRIEPVCRVTGISDLSHLIASHIKPWAESNNDERIDRYNGLLLSPDVDHLFDRGFISFTNEGDLIGSPHIESDILRRMGIDLDKVEVKERFNEEQIVYLDHHRNYVLRKSRGK